MRKLLIVMFCLGVIKSYSQRRNPSSTCITTILKLSNDWKTDSFATDGFRANNYKKIMTCKDQLKKISRPFLVNYLGKPTKIEHTNNGVNYLYFVIDRRNNKNDSANLKDGLAIVFHFDRYEKYLTSLEELMLDR